MELHIGAKINILSKSKIILESVTELRNESQSYRGYSPDVNVSADVNAGDIIGSIDIFRTKEKDIIAKWFAWDGKYWGFDETQYKKLRSLAEEIQKHKIYRDKISLRFVEGIIFDWVKERYQNKTEVDFIDYFEMKCCNILREYEIWIPIFDLHIEVDITIGKVMFKTITRHMLDEWIERKRELIPVEHFEAYSQKTRKDVQSFAATVVKVWAEPIRAFDVAYELTEEALAVLRVLSPANFSPKVVCYCVPLGKQKVEEYKYFHVHNGRIVCKKSGVLDGTHQPWILNIQMIETLKGYGLNSVGEVLQKEEKTKFQEVVLNSLIMYSKSCLMKEASDKLVYILVALETLLLKDPNEPIMQNIAERMAFIVRDTAEERKNIVKLVKEIYSLRSKFIHHGQSIDNMEQLEKFMAEASWFFVKMSMNISAHVTKEAFIEKLEELKFS